MRTGLLKVLVGIAVLAWHLPCFSQERIALWEGTKVRHGKEVVMEAYRPQDGNGISVIVCPGGSYYWHDSDNEGEKVGQWLSENGITAFVLYYRAAGCAEIAFNSRFMLDALKNSETDEILMELGGAVAPMKLLPSDGSDSFLFLVLPVRMKR